MNGSGDGEKPRIVLPCVEVPGILEEDVGDRKIVRAGTDRREGIDEGAAVGPAIPRDSWPGPAPRSAARARAGPPGSGLVVEVAEHDLGGRCPGRASRPPGAGSRSPPKRTGRTGGTSVPPKYSGAA